MAEIKVQNAKVSRIIDGYGFGAVVEKTLPSGDTKKEKYTVWTDTRVNVGDVVSISGLPSAKVEEFTNEKGEEIRYAVIHINNAKVEADAPF